MRSKFIFSWDQIFFHFFEVKILIIIRSPDHGIIHEIKIKKALLGNFDLMINLLAASTIMRLKFKINYLNLVSYTCGKFLALIISHLYKKLSISWSHLQLTNQSWDWNCLIMLYFNFNLMIDLLATRTIMRSKL